ncbi:MAG: glycosyltransferase [Bacteroidota bacterium]|nr:glycosyltransferase [Bacteroidota bacterium]
MSLTDKVIKNTFYYIVFQLFGFLFPLILTPFIISEIGEVQYGIYVLVLGFIGMFNLFDISISSSFIIFISRYYVKKDFTNLNKYFNTGLFFYICFSIIIVLIGFVFAKPLLSLLKIPSELFDTSVKVYYIGLLVFFVSSAFTIFSSVLISLQKMYVSSVAGIFIGLINFAATIVILNIGYGLVGILWLQLFSVTLTNIIIIWYAKLSLPELKIGFKHIEKNPVKEMTKFGAQMQVSKLASFASEKYDEFLLAYFSVLNNVTYFNIANKISRTGRLIPFQVVYQVAPISSELNARGDKEKLSELFLDTTKYLILVSAPVFIFIFIFSDLIITTWVGEGFEMSSRVLRILVIGQLFNMTLSAPGNSIIPNVGIPKFQMREGLIYLGINLILSFLLIKYFGIIGAAVGSVSSTVIASIYLYNASTNFFSKDKFKLLFNKYLKPVAASIVSGLVTGLIFFVSNKFLFSFKGRISGIFYLIFMCGIFLFLYTAWIFNSNYLNPKDKKLVARVIYKIIPKKFLFNADKSSQRKNISYNNELVSIFIITHNRLELLRKCILSMLPTLKNINYELIIVDNASNDGTKEFLNELKISNDRLKIVTEEKNTGINARAVGAEESKGKYIVGVDNDVIMFPDDWIEQMVLAYNKIPRMGFLTADVVQDETTTGAKQPDESYTEELYDDGKIKLLVGPSGGWCFMISREVYHKVGKFLTIKDRIFFGDDDDYVNRVIDKGLKFGILSGLKVYHASGEFYNKNYMNIFENKFEDFNKGYPLIYTIRRKIRRRLGMRRYIAKIREMWENEAR